MKWFLKEVTRIALINFIFLLIAVALISFKMPWKVQITNLAASIPESTPIADSASTSVPVRDIFSELKNHNLKSDCWIGYREHVYDITSVFGTHPGGDEIMLKYCGNDATTGFDTKERSPAMPHSASSTSLLEQYLVQ